MEGADWTGPVTTRHSDGATPMPNPPTPTSHSSRWQSSRHPVKCWLWVRSTNGSWTCSLTTGRTSSDGRTPSGTHCPSMTASSRCRVLRTNRERVHTGPYTQTLETCLKTAATCGARRGSSVRRRWQWNQMEGKSKGEEEAEKVHRLQDTPSNHQDSWTRPCPPPARLPHLQVWTCGEALVWHQIWRCLAHRSCPPCHCPHIPWHMSPRCTSKETPTTPLTTRSLSTT